MSQTQQTDTDLLMEAILSGKPVDPEVEKRVMERSKKVQEEILRTKGIQEVVVEALRESRDE